MFKPNLLRNQKWVELDPSIKENLINLCDIKRGQSTNNEELYARGS